MNLRKIKVGIIGSGAPHAENSHLPALASIKEVELTAFCDLDPDLLQSTMKRYQVKQGFHDYREMIDQVKLDAVFVIVRPSRLKNIVLDCFKQGLAVSIEKTPGISSSETRQMWEEAQRNNCPNMVGFDRRFSNPVLKTLSLVGSSLPRRISGRFYRPYQTLPDPMDAIIHGVDLMRFLGGEIKETKFSSHRHSGNLDGFDLLIKFANGANGTFQAATYSPVTMEIYEVEYENCFYRIDIVNQKLEIMNAKRIKTYEAIDLTNSAIESKKGYWENCHFIQCLLDGIPPAPNLLDSLKTMEFAEKIRDYLNIQTPHI